MMLKRAQFLLMGFVLGAAFGAQGALYSWTGTPNAVIPDNASTGYAFTGPGAGDWSSPFGNGTISGLDVRLEISGCNGGGYIGDLYAYLTYTVNGNSTSLILLNRVGRAGANDAGYGATSLNVILTGDASHGWSDIHLTATPEENGTYLADARITSPIGDFTGAARTPAAGLEFFNNSSLAADGTWSLFLADCAAGDQSKLVSWSLDLSVTPVPEPVNVALGVFGGALAAVVLIRNKSVRARIQRWRAEINRWLDAV